MCGMRDRVLPAGVEHHVTARTKYHRPVKLIHLQRRFLWPRASTRCMLHFYRVLRIPRRYYRLQKNFPRTLSPQGEVRRRKFVASHLGGAMNFIARTIMFLLAAFILSGECAAQSRRTPTNSSSNSSNEAEIRDRLNSWTIGLAGGLLEGAPIRFATEISRVVNDGGTMHVLPVVTRGPTENVNDLLYLRGIDAAIINSDSLDEYKSQVPQIQQRISYLISRFPSELQILVRPEIRSLSDLAGKKVNFNTQGTAAAYSGPLIFSRLGLDVEKTFIPHPVALEQ